MAPAPAAANPLDFLGGMLNQLNPLRPPEKATSLLGKARNILNPLRRGTLGQDALIGGLIEMSPLPRNVKDGINNAILVKEGAQLAGAVPVIGPVLKPLVAATALEMLTARPVGGALYGPGTPYKTYADYAAANRQNQPRPTATLSDTPPEPGQADVTPSPVRQAAEEVAPELPRTDSRQFTDQTTSRTQAPPSVQREESPPAPRVDPMDLFEKARAKAVQSGRQEDLDLVRDYGLALHAQHFNKTSPLNVSDQTAKAKSFLETQIA